MRQFYLFDMYHSSRCTPKRHKSAFSQDNILPDSRSVFKSGVFDLHNFVGNISQRAIEHLILKKLPDRTVLIDDDNFLDFILFQISNF